jgi:hypothetical protein
MTSHQPTADANETSLEESVEAGREVRDVSVRGILYLAVAVVVLAAAIHLLLWWLFGVYERQAASQDPKQSPLFDPQQQPPEPRLQNTPTRDYAEFRRQQEQQLNSYGWVDRQKEVVHIPVSRAMELLLDRGLPEPTGQANPEQEQPEKQQQEAQKQQQEQTE